jgi:hypothetical protein
MTVGGPLRAVVILGLTASLALGSSLAPPLRAQVSFNGPEFQVNTYTTGNQVRPSVALNDQGEFVVVWASYGSAGSDQDMGSIQAQRYSPDGAAAGAQFQVNTYATSNQLAPAVAIGPQGDFVVVWASFGSSGTDTSLWSIQAQRYSSSGAPVGSQFQVNTYTSMFQEEPAVAMDPSGKFVVAWKSSGSSGSDTYYGILAQRFDANGTRLGAEFQVNSYTFGYQTRPAVATDALGNFVIAWESAFSGGTDHSGYSIHAQRFSAGGTPLGSEFQVNTYTTNNQYNPSVASDAQGDFVVAWESYGSSGTDTSEFSVQAQRFDDTGAPVGAQFQVNSLTGYSQRLPAVASDSNGGFVVVWQSFWVPGDITGSIQGQRFSADGSGLGSEFTVNTYTWTAQTSPRVASDALGNFVVVWRGMGSSGTDTDSGSIHGQRFDQLFSDGFESGDAARWSAVSP